MDSRKRSALFFIISFCAAIIALVYFPDAVTANPVPVNVPFQPQPPSHFPVIPSLLLFLEGIVLVSLARSTDIYRLRFVIAWFAVTFVTWRAFVIMLEYLSKMLMITASLTLGEIIVVLIEAPAIYAMLRLKIFVRQQSNAPSLISALWFSLVANLVSFGASFLLTPFTF